MRWFCRILQPVNLKNLRWIFFSAMVKFQILSCPPKFLETTSFTCLGFLECIFLPGFVETNVDTLEKSHHLVDHSAVFDLYQYLSDPCVVMIFYAYIYYKSDFKYRQICKSDGSYEIWSSAKRNDANQKSQQFPFRLHVFVHPAIWSWIKQHHEADVCRGQIPWEF